MAVDDLVAKIDQLPLRDARVAEVKVPVQMVPVEMRNSGGDSGMLFEGDGRRSAIIVVFPCSGTDRK